MAVESFTPAARSVTLETGLKLAYVEQGGPAGIPVILLHGLTDSWRSFRRVLLHLPPSLHVFALSQRGHGDSDRPPRGYAPQDFSNDLAGFMDALDLPRAVIVGHCMGAWVAQRFALDHPDRVLGLVLAGAFVPKPGNPGLRDLWDSAVSKLNDPIDPAFVREFQVSTLAQDVPPAFLDSVIAESLKVPARVWCAALEPLLEVDFASEIETVASPTLIVWGDRDSLTSRREQEILNESIAASTLAIYSGAGHAVHWEEPSRFAWDVSGFVRKLANGK
jgi:non-heme chloroperoxidase